MSLKDLDDAYTKSKAPERQAFQGLPQGKYQARVLNVDLTKTAKPPHKPMLKLEFEVLAGPMAGRRDFKNIVFDKDRPESLDYAKADLENLGWKNSLGDLEDPSKRGLLIDRKVEIYKSIKPPKPGQTQPNTNVYINAPLETAITAQAASASAVARASAVSGDEPPF